MSTASLKNYLEYVTVVKIAWKIIVINIAVIILLFIIVPFSPETLGRVAYFLIEFIREYILFNIFDAVILDKVIMTLLLALPSIVTSFIVVLYYIKTFSFKCPKCNTYIARNKSVYMALIPPDKCPECSISFKTN